MFGMRPMKTRPEKKSYCSKCGEERKQSGDWKFGVGLQGWAHSHADGTAYSQVELTEDEHAEQFPKSRIFQSDGGSCVVTDP